MRGQTTSLPIHLYERGQTTSFPINLYETSTSISLPIVLYEADISSSLPIYLTEKMSIKKLNLPITPIDYRKSSSTFYNTTLPHESFAVNKKHDEKNLSKIMF